VENAPHTAVVAGNTGVTTKDAFDNYRFDLGGRFIGVR